MSPLSRFLGTLLLLGILLSPFCFGGELSNQLTEIQNGIEKEKGYIAELKTKIEEQLEENKDYIERAEEARKVMARRKEIVETNRKYQLDLISLEEKLFKLGAVQREYELQFQPKIALDRGHIFPSIMDKDGVILRNAVVTNITDRVFVTSGSKMTYVNIENLPSNIINNSIVPPTTRYRSEYSAEEVWKSRPMNNLSSSLRTAMKQQEYEHNKLKAEEEKIASVRRREELEKERMEQQNARKEELKEIAKNKELLESEIDRLSNEITLLETRRRQIADAKSRRISDFNDAKIKPDRKVHEKYLNSADRAIYEVDQKTNALNSKINDLRSQISNL